MSGLKYRTIILLVATFYVRYSSTTIIVREDDSHPVVPYVPFVVLNDTDKNDFNYDSLQEIIARYLEQNGNVPVQLTTTTVGTLIEESAAHGTSLFDYLKTSNELRNYSDVDVHLKTSYETNDSFNSNRNNNNSNHNFNNINNNNNNNNNNNFNNRTNYNYDNAADRIKSASNGKQFVNPTTVTVAVTTYRPYQVTESKEQDIGQSMNNIYRKSPFNSLSITGQSAFVPSAIGHTMTTSLAKTSKHNSPRRPNIWPAVGNKFPYYYDMNASGTVSSGLKSRKGGSNPSIRASSSLLRNADLTCNIKSVRYIRNGDCISKKPIFESVCAEKCLEYDPKILKKKHGDVSRKHQSKILAVQYYPSQSLDCMDGDTRKINVNLHCKDGTVKNAFIRVVKDCICMKHGDLKDTNKKTATKKTNQNNNFAYKYVSPYY